MTPTPEVPEPAKPPSSPGAFAKFWKWFKILVPPFLILPLLRIPFDFMTAVLWLALFIAFLKASIHLMKWSTQTLRRLMKKQEPLREPARIRSFLTVVFCVVVTYCHVLSLNAADEFALATGQSMLAACKSQKQCAVPQDIKTMSGVTDASEENYGIFYGQWGPRFKIHFSVSEDRQEFTIRVWHDMDQAYIVTGGVSQNLEEETLNR